MWLSLVLMMYSVGLSLSQVDVVEHECFEDPNKTKQVSFKLDSYSYTYTLN